MLDESLSDIDMSRLPEDNLEQIVEEAADPILCARALQKYVEGKSPEAQESFLRRGINQMSLRFAYDYMNRPVQISIEDHFDIAGSNEAADFMEILAILQSGRSVRAGGKMSPFENHYYIDPTTREKRQILSLRLHSPAFIDPERKDEGKVVPLENYITIPVTAISDYAIGERV